MIDASLGIFLFIVALAIGFGLVNGFNDAANALAASVGSHSLSLRGAITLAAVCNLVGAVSGLAVAKTIGKGILIPEAITFPTMIAALVSVIIWGSIATRLGLPVSITHSFVSGLAAAGIALAGSEAVQWHIIQKVGISVIAAPTLGFIGGFVMMVALLWIFQRGAPSRMRNLFSRLQWFTTAFLAYSHGKNDGQMPIGVITMALVVYTGQITLWENIPWWVVVVSALSISLGTAFGGRRVIKTLGMRITKLEPKASP